MLFYVNPLPPDIGISGERIDMIITSFWNKGNCHLADVSKIDRGPVGLKKMF
jgi:hypothetical protein